MRVKESNRRLVADVIVGYYSRENFSHSELLAKRYRDAAASNAVKANTHDAHHGSTNASSFHCNNQLPGESDDSGDDDVAQGPLADPMTISVLDTSLTCRGSDIPGFDTKIVNGNLPSAAAIARRQTKRERRDAHQVSIRRKVEEKEAERRRMSAEIDR